MTDAAKSDKSLAAAARAKKHVNFLSQWIVPSADDCTFNIPIFFLLSSFLLQSSEPENRQYLHECRTISLWWERGLKNGHFDGIFRKKWVRYIYFHHEWKPRLVLLAATLESSIEVLNYFKVKHGKMRLPASNEIEVCLVSLEKVLFFLRQMQKCPFNRNSAHKFCKTTAGTCDKFFELTSCKKKAAAYTDLLRTQLSLENKSLSDHARVLTPDLLKTAAALSPYCSFPKKAKKKRRSPHTTSGSFSAPTSQYHEEEQEEQEEKPHKRAKISTLPPLPIVADDVEVDNQVHENPMQSVEPSEATLLLAAKRPTAPLPTIPKMAPASQCASAITASSSPQVLMTSETVRESTVARVEPGLNFGSLEADVRAVRTSFELRRAELAKLYKYECERIDAEELSLLSQAGLLWQCVESRDSPERILALYGLFSKACELALGDGAIQR